MALDVLRRGAHCPWRVELDTDTFIQEAKTTKGKDAKKTAVGAGDPAELAPETELRFTLNSPISITEKK